MTTTNTQAPAATEAPSPDQLGRDVAAWTGFEYTGFRTDTGLPEQRVNVSVERLGHAVAAILEKHLAAVGASVQPVQASLSDEPVRLALDALEEIALAGMSGTGQESEEGMQAWHARRAWEFIGIAARARDEVRAALATKGGSAA